ncbi:DUF998 domain-containing protein [Deinococcus aestuarii]|uniref:DUF998 domain-containing protein n=1 Tax=Deinococcus aestuarii TaxID=2774531 RepID=UPI001C0DA652|nr:DUF998 domain-containing protein [Deinococcus aestuarii]
MTDRAPAPPRLLPRFGAALWVVGALQFLAAHLIVQTAWSAPYRWSANNISDLGNVRCGPWGDPPRDVCSPLHGLMNVSFAVQGAALLLGALLLWTCWRPTRASRAGRVLLLAGGAGWVAAGLFPADVNENLHVLGAVLIFFAGNLGLLLAGPAFAGRPGLALPRLGALLGAAGLLGMGLLFGGQFLGLGMGGMERVTVFPLQVWTLLAGSAVLGTPSVRRRTVRRGE